MQEDSGYPRLEDQIAWYDKKNIAAQKYYRAFKVVQIGVAAVIPVASLLNRESAIIPGVLGAVILLLEGLQELGNYRNNWQKYRGACEALRHEKYLFLAGAGPYSEMEETVARRALAERVEEMISQEHTDWKRQFQKQEKGQ